MKALLAFLTLAACILQAQTVGQFSIPKYTSTGLQYTWLTPSASKVFGLDASGNLVLTTPASSVWADITGKPSVFPPDAHDQDISTITGLQDALDSKVRQNQLSEFPGENTVMQRSDTGVAWAEEFYVGEDSGRRLDIHAGGFIVRYPSGDNLAINTPATIDDGYTLTLPAANGTLLTSNSSLPAANLTGSINAARLGTGTASASTYLRGDGTWATVTGGITSITGTPNQITVTGTTTPVLSLPATITGLSSVTSTSFVGSLTGVASGNATLGANTFTASQTLSSGRIILSALSTAAAPALTFANAGQAGFFSPTTGGILYYGGTNMGVQFGLVPNGVFKIGYSGSVQFAPGSADGAADAVLGRIAADSLSQYRGTNAQSLSVSNTHTSNSSYERAVIDWQTTPNILRIGSDKGSGGGSSREVRVIMGGTAKITLDTSGNVILSVLPTASAGLPSGALWRDAAAGNVIKQVP